VAFGKDISWEENNYSNSCQTPKKNLILAKHKFDVNMEW